MQTLTDKEIETIFTIAHNGPITGYDLHLGGKRKRGKKTAIMSSAHWLKVKKNLGSKGKNLIKLVPKHATKKYSNRLYSDERGRRKDIYDLTLLGWIVVSGQETLSAVQISRIVKVFKKDVPLVFGEWNYFKKEGIEAISKKHLINTMKVCFSKYLVLLTNADIKFKKIRHEEPGFSEKQFWNDFIKELLTEKRWIKQLTDIFLYHKLGLNQIEYGLDEYRLSIYEEDKLRNVFNRNKKLYFYRTLICRKKKLSSLLDEMQQEMNSFSDFDINYFIEFEKNFFNLTRCKNKLSSRLSWKIKDESEIKNISPFVDIPKLIYEGNYFGATLKLCNLYQNYPFLNWEEYFAAIPEFMSQEAESMITHINLRSEINKTKDVLTTRKEDWESAMLEILAALPFFDIEPVQVWDATFYQMKPNLEKFKKMFIEQKKGKGIGFYNNDEGIEQAKANAITDIKNQLEQNKTKQSGISLYDLSKVYVRKQFEKN